MGSPSDTILFASWCCRIGTLCQIQYYLQVGAVELERSELGPKELESMRACIEGKSVRLRAYILKYSNHVVSMEVV